MLRRAHRAAKIQGMSARPETIQAAREVIDLITEGMTLTAAVKSRGMSLKSFQSALSSVRELGADYARARELRADVLVEEAIAAADDPNLDPQRARNMMTIRQWTASKHSSKVYGERVDVNVSQVLSISDALSEARGRMLRPICDLPEPIDAQVIDIPMLSGPKPTDTESDTSAPEPAGPDIFS